MIAPTSAPRIARRLVIRGHVQGVRYRQSTAEIANAAALAGWVQNLPDGAVEAWLEGPPEAVERVITWCRQGPPYAHVDTVNIESVAPADLPPPFAVRR